MSVGDKSMSVARVLGYEYSCVRSVRGIPMSVQS